MRTRLSVTLLVAVSSVFHAQSALADPPVPPDAPAPPGAPAPPSTPPPQPAQPAPPSTSPPTPAPAPAKPAPPATPESPTPPPSPKTHPGKAPPNTQTGSTYPEPPLVVSPEAPVALPPVGMPPPPGAQPQGLGNDGQPLAGYHNGLFYLRSRDDNFRLYLTGRMQLDSYNYFGPAVEHTTLKSTLFVRRLRPELSGEFLGYWQWVLAGDWGATSLDNPRGTNETTAGSPGTLPTDKSARYASAQTAGLRALATDAYLNFRGDALLNVQVGQFDGPFTMENRTSDKYLPFMERSVAIRAFGIPTNKELGIMVWGEMPSRLVYYSVGIFDGDGQGRLNPDNRIDVMGRVFVHPLISRKDELRDLQIGGSFRHGRRDPDYVFYDYPGMSTQGAFTFWNPTYNASKGVTRILPSGPQTALAGELRIPVSRFDLTSEVVWVHNGTREAVDGTEATNRERFGDIHGVSYYAQLGFWVLGSRDINGLPGYENLAHLDFSKASQPLTRAVQLLVKWEQLRVHYDSASRAGSPDAQNVDGDIKLDAISFGANYWATKHVRLTTNYVVNMFPDSAPTKGTPAQTATQRAVAPGNTIAAGIDDGRRQSAHVLHELLFRAAVSF